MNLSSFWQSLSEANVNLTGLNRDALASVLLAITDSPTDPHIILTRRAEAMSTHSGQVAFPGGRWENGDGSLAQTALRESQEEISLSPDIVIVRGRLPERPSRHGLMVYPFVATVPTELDLVENPEEIAVIFHVPLKFFLETKPDRVDKFDRKGLRVQVPAWYFEGQEIWGLTAVILQDMLKLIAPDTKYP